MRAVLLAIAVVVGTVDDARACKVAHPAPYEPVAIAGDVTPPSRPTVEVALREPRAWFGIPGLCGSIGRIVLRPIATDDHAKRLGFVITAIGDDGGVMMTLWKPVQPDADGTIAIAYRDGAFTVEYEVRAIDGNGNLSEPARISIDVPRHIHWGRYLVLACLLGVATLAVQLHRRRKRDPFRL